VVNAVAPAPQSPIVVVAGGVTPPRPGLRRLLPEAPALVVAADSGVVHAEQLGLDIDLVVGDLDSVERAALARAVTAGALVDRHRPDKDKTDLELALDAAAERSTPGGSVVVVASVGGRLDHGLANLLLLAAPAYAHLRVDAYVDAWHVTVVRREARLAVRPGGLVTLLPVGGDAHGVATRHLAYPLVGETLAAGTSRGVSNVADGEEVVVAVDAGVLLVLREWAD
jgi:thiamine pyrophosphokinase